MPASPKDLGILFRGDMVRAILAGQKRVTRRAMKPQPNTKPNTDWKGLGLLWYPSGPEHPKSLAYDGEAHFRRGVAVDFPCRYTPGRRLWVRETWAPHPEDRQDPPEVVVYHADGTAWAADPHRPAHVNRRKPSMDLDRDPTLPEPKWRPSLHMPRWASRLALRVTDVRAERLTEITDEDVALEGFEHAGLGTTAACFVREYREMHKLRRQLDDEREHSRRMAATLRAFRTVAEDRAAERDAHIAWLEARLGEYAAACRRAKG